MAYEEQINFLKSAANTSLGGLSDPGGITSAADFNQAIAGWQTYTNAELGFSFKYPSTWKLVDETADPMSAVTTDYAATTYGQGYDLKELIPLDYFAIWEAAGVNARKNVPNPITGIECSKQTKTVNQGYADNGADFSSKQNYTLASGQQTIYAQWNVIKPHQYFVATNKGVLCTLSQTTTDGSPLTKAEDSQGMGIINSFKFLQIRPRKKQSKKIAFFLVRSAGIGPATFWTATRRSIP